MREDLDRPKVTMRRLTVADTALATQMFATLSEIFETDYEPLDNAGLLALLSRDDFWAMAAVAVRPDASVVEVVGGATGYTLPLTRAPIQELFLYDIAVRPRWQRLGVGRALLTRLSEEAAAAGIQEIFVFADNEDEHALDFYRALGGSAAAVTGFSFPVRARPGAGSPQSK